MKRCADLLVERRGARRAGLARDRGRVTGQVGDQVTLLPGRVLERRAIAATREQGLLRIAQPRAGDQEAPHVLGPAPGQLVQRPGGDRRPPELLDCVRLVAPALFAEAPGKLVPRRCEVRGCEPVELVGRLVDHVGANDRELLASSVAWSRE